MALRQLSFLDAGRVVRTRASGLQCAPAHAHVDAGVLHVEFVVSSDLRFGLVLARLGHPSFWVVVVGEKTLRGAIPPDVVFSMQAFFSSKQRE